MVAISETWLNDTVADSELEIGFPEHTWFRRDRGSRGGGVACAVRSSLLPLRLPDPAGTECLLIRLRSVSVVVAVCYRPPDDDTVLGQCSPRAHQSPARPGPGPWALGPAQTQPVQINIMLARARQGPYNISPSDYHS